MKKRILSILTVMAMLLSMCAVSVSAENVDLTGITTPVTYNYSVTGEASKTGTTETGLKKVFGGNNSHLATKITAESELISNKEFTLTSEDANATGTKEVTVGQTIVISYRIASDDWSNSANVIVRGGIKGKAEDDTSLNARFEPKHCSGEFTKSTLKTGDFDSEGKLSGTLPVNKAPNQKWVKYDVVIKVDNEGNKVSFYADGKPFFTDKSMGLAAYSTVTTPNLQMYIKKGFNIYISDVSMTIYPVGYNGDFVEENPLVLTDDFLLEDDGSIIYKGVKTFYDADTELVTKDGWTAQYVKEGYVRIIKGTTSAGEIYYYEKAADRINGFALTDVDTSAGEKSLSVEVKNVDAEESVSPVLLLASYSGSNMVKVAISDAVTIAAGKTGTLTASLMVAAEENVSEIRAFLLDSKGSLIPIKSVISTN